LSRDVKEEALVEVVDTEVVEVVDTEVVEVEEEVASASSIRRETVPLAKIVGSGTKMEVMEAVVIVEVVDSVQEAEDTAEVAAALEVVDMAEVVEAEFASTTRKVHVLMAITAASSTSKLKLNQLKLIWIS